MKNLALKFLAVNKVAKLKNIAAMEPNSLLGKQ